DSVQQFGVVIAVPCCAGQSLHIFRETGTAVAAARVDKVIADTRIGADTPTNFFNVCPQTLSQVGHFVHKADLGGQHRIGSVFGQFRRPNIHENHTIVVAIERVINLTQYIRSLLAVGTDHDAVRLHEIV